VSTTPPRNVIYYNDGSNPIPLAGISGLPYTDVILAFLVPGDNLTLTGHGGAFGSGGNPNPEDIQALQNAGKNVLISVGGAKESFPSSDWQQYAQDVNGLVEQIAGYVTANGFSGVDIDYEDDYGFTGGPYGTGVYDGVTFLIELTNVLARELPPGQNIITRAPQPPYFDPNNERYNSAYARIWQGAGNNISWFNCQFYNNPSYDASASSKVSYYEIFAGIIDESDLLMGVLSILLAAGTSRSTNSPARSSPRCYRHLVPRLVASWAGSFHTINAEPGRREPRKQSPAVRARLSLARTTPHSQGIRCTRT
jgi:chitinase